MIGPLDGIRVVEISSWMAAPSAGAVLADMGADVVKIEPLDRRRRAGHEPPPKRPTARHLDYSFQMDNRGKRSVAVAIDRDEGAEIVRRLVDDADVFLCNLLPHRQERYGLDPATLQARNARRSSTRRCPATASSAPTPTVPASTSRRSSAEARSPTR